MLLVDASPRVRNLTPALCSNANPALLRAPPQHSHRPQSPPAFTYNCHPRVDPHEALSRHITEKTTMDDIKDNPNSDSTMI